MNPYVLTNASISVAILACLWFWAHATVRRDSYRYDIRGIRDGLFDFMWKNDLPFDNEAYRQVRDGLNGLLRTSNTTSLLEFFCLVVSHIRQGDFASTDHVVQLPEGPLKQELIRVRHTATGRLLRFLFREGVTGIVVSALLFFAELISLAAAIKNGASRHADRLLQDFRDCGPTSLSSQI